MRDGYITFLAIQEKWQVDIGFDLESKESKSCVPIGFRDRRYWREGQDWSSDDG